MTTLKPGLLARLHKDLSELTENPYPGIKLHQQYARNLLKFCLHLSPSSGPFAGLRIHFDMELPQNWPHSPPVIRSSTRLEHPNIYSSYICCDLLRATTASKGVSFSRAM